MTLFDFLNDVAQTALFDTFVRGIEILLIAAIPLLAKLGYHLYKLAVEWVKTRLNDKQEAVLKELLLVAIRQTEQKRVKEQILQSAREAFSHTLDSLQIMLRNRGLTVWANRRDELEARIEAALREGLHKVEQPIAVADAQTVIIHNDTSDAKNRIMAQIRATNYE